MRALCLALVLMPTPVLSEAYHDIGRPDQCGAYGEAAFDGEIWFPGGEGGMITLTDPQSVRGLDGALFDGVISEEGASDPAGRVLALRGQLASAEGAEGGDILIIATEAGIRLLQPCP